MIEPPIPSRSPLEQLVYLLSDGATITKVSETPVAGNGLAYCYVEATTSNGNSVCYSRLREGGSELMRWR